MKLVTSNYFLVLFYNSEIWLMQALTHQTKGQIMDVSANPLKIICPNYDQSSSIERLHQIVKRPTPISPMKYKHVVLLFKIYKSKNQEHDWTDIFSTRISMQDQIQ